MKWSIEAISGEDSSKTKHVEKVLKKLGRLDKNAKLSAHETTFAQKVAFRELKPDNYEDVKFDCLGGLDSEIEQIKQALLRPIQRRKLLKCTMDDDEMSATLNNYTPTMGLLLHGPPGTGKTALVKSVSAELDAAFMPVDINRFRNLYALY